jgi:hypothetical protein
MLKAMRLHCTRYIAGSPLKTSAHPMVGINKSGLPKLLGPVKTLANGGTDDKRFLLTLLILSRDLEGWVPVDLSPIESPPKVEIDMDLVKQISDLAIPFGSVKTEFEDYHLSMKSGPNGLSLDTSTVDLKLLPASGIAKAITTLGGEILIERMNEVFSTLEEIPVEPLTKIKSDLTLRRISVKKDKESKSRVFAILDYWSQCALKTLHQEIINLLKRIKADCTFDQGSRIGKVLPNPHYWSIDLTNATDRFPIVLQEAVLKHLIGEVKANAWTKILTQLPFLYQGKPIFYKTGQPMGAYSSWAVFALTHHLTVQYAAGIVGKTKYSNYMLLGDDIVIGDDDVAKSYLDVLTKLGVETSPSKTHISLHSYEFAKRWFHHGVEITGLPLHGIFNYSGPATVLNFVHTMNRNWASSHQTLLSRQEISQLLSCVIPRHKVRFETERVWESSILPHGKASHPHNFENIWLTYQHLCKEHIGCHVSTDKVISLLDQLIPMAKIKASQKAIKDTVKGVVNYQRTLIKNIASHPEFNRELLPDLPNLIQILPVVRASLAYARGAQLQLDRMEDLIGRFVEEEILDDPVVLGFDPTKMIQIDRAEARFLVHSKVPKEIKLAVKMHAEQRKKLRAMNYQQADEFLFQLLGSRTW